MGEVLLRAYERTEDPKKLRRAGFVPGVIYSDGEEGPLSVKFKLRNLRKHLSNHYKSSILRVKINETVKGCIVRGIQKNGLTGEFLHIDLQPVNMSDIVKLKLPIIFTGMGRIEEQRLMIHLELPEIEVTGKMSDLPEVIEIDVSNKVYGDKILLKDLNLNECIEISSYEDDVVAVVLAN